MKGQITDIGTLKAHVLAFIDGTDQSPANAVSIEVALLDFFPEDPQVNDAVIALACYSPRGGEHLYSASEIVRELQSILHKLEP